MRSRERPQNPLIANTFYRAGFIESWGRGIKKITDSCESYHIPAPKYYISGSDISIEFNIDDIENAKIKPGTNVGINVGTNVGLFLSERQEKILFIIKNEPTITTQRLSSQLNVHEKTIERDIKTLKQNNLLKRVGSNKSGKWVVI